MGDSRRHRGLVAVRLARCVAMLAVATSFGCGGSEPPATGPEAERPAAEATPNGGARAATETKRGSSPAYVPPQVKVDLFPQVVLKTSHGDVTIRLNYEKAPATVTNFLSYVDSHHYDGTIFHQVETGYAVVGGGYTSDLTPKPVRYPIRNEADNGLRNVRGTIAMARDLNSINSSTCQFFINLSDNAALDHRGSEPQAYGFCVFGEVVEGMDVLDRIADVSVVEHEPFTKLPTRTVLIESAVRLR